MSFCMNEVLGHLLESFQGISSWEEIYWAPSRRLFLGRNFLCSSYRKGSLAYESGPSSMHTMKYFQMCNYVIIIPHARYIQDLGSPSGLLGCSLGLDLWSTALGATKEALGRTNQIKNVPTWVVIFRHCHYNCSLQWSETARRMSVPNYGAGHDATQFSSNIKVVFLLGLEIRNLVSPVSHES